MEVILNSGAERTIREETQRFPNQECAGLLLGRFDESTNEIQVLESSQTGPQARHGTSFVSPDTGHFNRKIREAEERGLRFLGEWHKHPGGLTRPSSGDKRTIEEIMTSQGLSMYVAIIVTGAGPHAAFNSYLFHNSIEFNRIKCRTDFEGRFGRGFPMAEQARTLCESKKRTAVESTQRQDSNLKSSDSSVLDLESEYTEKPKGVIQRLSRFFVGNTQTGMRADDKQGSSQLKESPWFRSPQLKRRILFEKRVMTESFPDFTLQGNTNKIAWISSYQGHSVILKYPKTYPRTPLEIIITPDVAVLDDEYDCFYAALAAQTAKTRIDKALFNLERATTHTRSTKQTDEEEWYDTNKGSTRLKHELRKLAASNFPFNTFHTPNKLYAFEIHLHGSETLLVVCPSIYPQNPPQLSLISRVQDDALRERVGAVSQTIGSLWNPETDSILSAVQQVESILRRHMEVEQANENSYLR